jgi:competence protein ComEA
MNTGLFRRQIDGAIVVIAAAVLVHVCVYFYVAYKPGVKTLPYKDTHSGPVIVEIAGSAGNDGIYYVPVDTDVKTLLGYAGMHHTERFDPKTMETPLSTGQRVLIDSRGQLTVGEMENATRLACDLPIDINRAGVSDLVLIPGVGEKTAWKIIAQRNRMGGFQRIEDLMKIRGIKKGKFNRLKRYVTVNQRTQI